MLSPTWLGHRLPLCGVEYALTLDASKRNGMDKDTREHPVSMFVLIERNLFPLILQARKSS